MVFRFGVFEVDVRARELRKAGVRVKLQEQPWQVLVALLEHPGEVVTREELRRRLWPTDTFVDFDHSLNIAVNRIRDALGDAAASPRFVETIPRRGYRFISPVERLSGGPPQPTGGSMARARQPWIMWLVGAGGAALILLAVVWSRGSGLVRPEQPVKRIAVLPLKNLSPSPDSDYFSDGLTDQIIYNLSAIRGLEVKSRTSSFQFKGRESSIRDVGRQLQADFVLEGTVLREAGRLRLTVALVRVADDVELWSERYDREMADVFAIQEEISRSIVNELRLRGIGGQRRYDTNLEAYDLYLRALALTNESGPGEADAVRLDRAVALLRQVTTEDDQFAPAYAAMAEAYAHLRSRGRSRESTRLMREAAQRAITLDPLLPDAYVSLGAADASNLRWQEAESAFRRALELNPNSVRAHEDFALYVLAPEERTQEALAQVRRATELDPLSPSRRKQLTYILVRAGAYKEALATIEPVAAANPSDDFAGQLWARALWWDGQRDRALAILEKLPRSSHGYLGYAYAILGRRREAEALAAESDAAQARHRFLIYAGLGDRRRCFEALQAIAEADDFGADMSPGDPELAWLHDDPQMREFRRLRGLPVPGAK